MCHFAKRGLHIEKLHKSDGYSNKPYSLRAISRLAKGAES